MFFDPQVGERYQAAGVQDQQSASLAARWLQRRAMGAMVAAMLVMLLGLPLHLAGLRGHADPYLAAQVVAWLSCLLTLWTIWLTRHLFANTWRSLCRRRFGATELVTICALTAFVASCATLLDSHAPMYFDVAAMALAWIISGEAQAAAIQRRFECVLEQLAPLKLRLLLPSAPPAPHGEPLARWLGFTLLACAITALGMQLQRGSSVAFGLLASLAVVAAGCPCTLGITRSAAWQTGVERAAALGWLLPSGAAFSRIAAQPHLVAQYALPIGTVERGALINLARAVERTIRWNELWAIGLNLSLLPLALAGPLPSLVPAATMMLARLLIFCTIRVQSG